MLEYPAIVHTEADGYWIEFPDLKGCITEGDTMEELLYNAQEALSLYLESFENRETLPESSKPETIKADKIVMVEPLPDVLIPIMLKKIRKEKKLSQNDMAKMLEVSYQAYQKLENIKKFNARIKTLEKIARVLGKKISIHFY